MAKFLAASDVNDSVIANMKKVIEELENTMIKRATTNNSNFEETAAVGKEVSSFEEGTCRPSYDNFGASNSPEDDISKFQMDPPDVRDQKLMELEPYHEDKMVDEQSPRCFAVSAGVDIFEEGGPVAPVPSVGDILPAEDFKIEIIAWLLIGIILLTIISAVILLGVFCAQF